MSADPVTMFIATAASTLFDIKESKKQASIEKQRYEERKKLAERQAREAEDERRRDYEKAIASNLAVQAGSGLSLDSRSFLNIQDQSYYTMQKDISTIRLNLATDLGELGYASQLSESQRRKEQFGGWASITSAAIETKAKKDLFS